MTSPDSDRLGKLFQPRSIAVVGASNTPGKRGQILIANLRDVGFAGSIYPVNARYDEVLGLKCFPSLAALPAIPDVVAVCLAAEAVPGIIEECGRAGVRSVAVVSAAFADAGPEGLRLQQEMLAAADRHGIAIMGPNGLGILNRLDGVQYWILRPPGPDYLDRSTPSGVSAVVQSGAISMSIMADARERGLIFDYVVSAGNQASIDVADYIEWLLDHPRAEQKVIGAIVEGIGKPDKFRAVCARALRQGTAIVVLKAGRNEATQEFVSSHTGALVGSAEVLDQVLERYGVMSVGDPDEWLEQLVLMAHPLRPAGGSWCMITTSGGGNAVISDLARDLGLAIPPATPQLTAAMRRIADRPVLNPLDAGGYYDAPGRYSKAVGAAVDDPDLDLVIACVAWFPGDDEPSHELLEAGLRAAAERRKPVLIFSFSAGPIPRSTVRRLREAGVFPMRGCRNTLQALRRLVWWLGKRNSPPPALPTFGGTPEPTGANRNLDPGGTRRLLAEAGLSVPPWRTVESAEAAVAESTAFGLPAVLKLEHADLLHKTELGAVVLGLADDAAIAREFRRLRDVVAPKSGLAGTRIAVQKQVASGFEMLLAVRRDPVFGLYLALGLGGVFAELLKDVAVRPLPVERSDVEAMLQTLRGYPLLSGYRGGIGYDVPALIDAALRLATLAAAWGPRLDTIEINPLIVLSAGGGAWVADAVMNGVPEGEFA